MDKFSEKFIGVITKHVLTIPEDKYKKYTELSECGESVYPNDEVMRGFACRATRTELIKQAWSVNSINPSDYLDGFFNDETITLDYIEIEFENEQINSPVYFFPDRGIYAAALGKNRVYDVWLSWPCYPHGW